jgi:hypothetical protein
MSDGFGGAGTNRRPRVPRLPTPLPQHNYTQRETEAENPGHYPRVIGCYSYGALLIAKSPTGETVSRSLGGEYIESCIICNAAHLSHRYRQA